MLSGIYSHLVALICMVVHYIAALKNKKNKALTNILYHIEFQLCYVVVDKKIFLMNVVSRSTMNTNGGTEN